jgi:predicted enzyme related to lactoylglutathione lyase
MGVLNEAKAIAFVLSSNVAALKPFYRDVLGLELIGEDPFAATFSLGGGTTLRLTAVDGHAPGPHTILGWEVDDLDAALDRLSAAGVGCDIYEGMGQDARGVWTNPDGSSHILWFKDPEGNGLSLVQFG